MEENKICVYVKTDNDNNVIEVGSDIFIADLTNWIKIDEGVGDRYAHAQSQYFDKPLVDDSGQYNYKFIEETKALIEAEKGNAEEPQIG